MISLYKNPNGEGILTGKDPTVGVNPFLSQPGGDDIAALKKRIKELEGKVDQSRVKDIDKNLVVHGVMQILPPFPLPPPN